MFGLDGSPRVGVVVEGRLEPYGRGVGLVEVDGEQVADRVARVGDGDPGRVGVVEGVQEDREMGSGELHQLSSVKS